MANILKVKSVGDYERYYGVKSRHPLVSVIDYAAISPIRPSVNNYEVYGLFLHNRLSADLTYGCGRYDYRSGTLICVAPGQIGGTEDKGELIQLDGWSLLFHPDLLHGTPLAKSIREYTFFDYSVNEALHLMDEEYDVFVSLLRQIQHELDNKHDVFQNRILTEYISLLLNYCMRFYDRQFVTRKMDNIDLLKRFDALLNDYFDQERQLSDGLPYVQYCADHLCLSPNYFGDLIRKTTGDNARNYIYRHVLQLAKNELASGTPVSQVAYGLGFDYPQHFTRMFKQQTGMTPSEYCKSLQK